jgi:nicotinamide phosphoribosyltransferase
MISITNTLPGFHWLCGWVETLFVQVWYPITVATRSKRFRKVIYDYLVKTGDPAGLDFKLHDFGYRGCTCQEQAEIGSMAHLATGAMGTDTAVGIMRARESYFTDAMLAFSIPAAEHSTIGSWGKDGEERAFRNMLEQFGGGQLVAVVSDTYDLENAVKNMWCDSLKFNVENMNAMLVIRPDSGEPQEEVLAVARWIDEAYGSVVNEKGYKVLNNVRIIHGDQMDDEQSFHNVLSVLTEAGFSADNVAFGMGGGLLQKVNRDTFKFAMKCSAVKVNGEWRDVFKDPVGAPWKRSKKGRFTLTKDFKEVLLEEVSDGWELMEVLYRDGELVNYSTFEQVRKRSWNVFDQER